MGSWICAARSGNGHRTPEVGPGGLGNRLRQNGFPIGGFDAGLAYTDLDKVGTKLVLNAGMDAEKTRLDAFAATLSEQTTGSAGLINKWEAGVGFKRSLGGATLVGGVVSDYRSETLADIGIRFTF